MTLSDDMLRATLLERVRSVEGAAPALEPPAMLARRVAAGGRPSLRDRWIGWPFATAAGLVAVTAVVVIGTFIAARPPTGTPATVPPAASNSAAAPSASVGASASIEPSASPAPSMVAAGCDVLRFDARRCAAIVARARKQVTGQGDIVAVSVEAPDRSQGILLGGGAPIATVDFTLDGGLHQGVDVSCGHSFEGVSADRACASDPQISIYGGSRTTLRAARRPATRTIPVPPRPRVREPPSSRRRPRSSCGSSTSQSTMSGITRCWPVFPGCRTGCCPSEPPRSGIHDRPPTGSMTGSPSRSGAARIPARPNARARSTAFTTSRSTGLSRSMSISCSTSWS